MAYFTKINNSRRFALEDHANVSEVNRKSIWAVYDIRPGEALFLAPVGIGDDGEPCFVDEPQYFFDDEVREI